MNAPRALFVGLCVFMAACSTGTSPSALDPRGPAAARIERLWWLLLWIAVAVFAVVVALMVVAIVRRGGRQEDEEPGAEEPRWGERLIAIGGVVVPTIVLATVFLVSLADIRFLSADPDAGALRIEVEGRLWWWEVRYPEAGAVTANEIHIPVGTPVTLELTTDDVIHSVWIPELSSKTDMIPGRTNEMTLEADETGTYRGQCAEFCGLQHAKMAFYVVAEEPDDFRRWLANESAPREADGAGAAEDLYLRSSCAGCHAIRGTAADSDRGPDLTHFGSRGWIAAGELPNTRANLIQWIEDPQGIKPGAKMPPSELNRAEVEAIARYLEGLD